MELRKDIIKIFKCLTVMSAREISESNPRYVELLADKDEFIALSRRPISFLEKIRKIYINSYRFNRTWTSSS